MGEQMISWYREFSDKKVLLWGFGREGLSSYQFIRSLGIDQPIYVCDGNTSPENIQRIKNLTKNTVFITEKEIDDSFDLILKSPGIVVPKHLKHLSFSSQAQLFLEHYRDHTIGVTGTKGKSTTSSLIAAAISTVLPTHLVGNIGIPCFEAIQGMEKGDYAVFELSCHQLEFATVSPHIGVFLNLYEEHLDHYDSFEAYANAKANIFRHMKVGDECLISQDLSRYFDEIENPLIIGKYIYSKGNELIIPGHKLKVTTTSLIGDHNYTNMAVAYYVAKCFNVSDEDFIKAMEKFKPLPHRLTYLGEFDDIGFVDDSISTIGQSCISAIKSLPMTKTVLIGGMDRGIEYHELIDYLYSRDDINAICMYQSGRRVYQEYCLKYGERKTLYLVEDLKQAVELAKEITPKHHLVLLSPAASSYDHFKNFEERGDIFRKLVEEC